MYRIAVAEDNYFLAKTIQEKLSSFTDVKLKYIAENGSGLLEFLAKDALIDLILMDIEMPTKNGIETTKLVKNLYPQIKIIMLTVMDDDDHIFNAIKAGADGYLLKEISAFALRQSIEETMQGGASMSPSIATKTLRLLRNPISENHSEKIDYQLSTREIDVLEQLSKGLNYAHIAENLILSPHTIRKHIENIYRKLQVHNKIEAVEKAKNNRII